MPRAGNNPKRRVSPAGTLTEEGKRALLANAKYVGSGHHKRNPADYGLERTNPRPTKSLCDLVRIIPLSEAQELLRRGIQAETVSTLAYDGFPKYIWSVSEDGEIYEAKTDSSTPGDYHGYPLEDEDDFRAYIRRVWEQRCQTRGR